MSKKDNNDNLTDDQPDNLSRRNLLKSAGLVGAAAVSSVATSNVIAADSRDNKAGASSIMLREALEVLTAEEAETLEAICDCLVPTDEHGPGAKEARAVHYIDRSLASHNSDSREDYMVGLNALNEFARKTRGKAFSQLLRDQQDSILLAVQTNKITGFVPSGSGFFNMVRGHTIDGTFCDPYYGGNQNFVGWDMLKYPGIRLGVSASEVAQGANLQPNHQSAYDHSTYTKLADNGLDSDQGVDHA